MKLNERNDIGQLLMSATRDFHRRLAGEIQQMRVTEISAAQGAVLNHIFNHGPSRMVDIADSKGVKAQSLVKVINELEALDYVTRCVDDSDSRAKLIALTANGSNHIQYLSDATERVWQQYATDIGVDKARQIFSGLRALLSDKDGESR